MKIFFVMIALSISGKMMSQQLVLEQLRKDLPVILESEARILQYLSVLGKYNSSVSKAYFGLLRSTQASFVFWPGSKLSYFNEGRNAIESAVTQDPSSVEVRFARLLVQCNAPFYLGYSSQITEDINHIISGLKQNHNSDIAPMIVKHLIRMDCIGEKNISDLKNLD